jgi:hypothetical protein
MQPRNLQKRNKLGMEIKCSNVPECLFESWLSIRLLRFIRFLDFVRRPEFCYRTTFRKLNLVPPSDEGGRHILSWVL